MRRTGQPFAPVRRLGAPPPYDVDAAQALSDELAGRVQRSPAAAPQPVVQPRADPQPPAAGRKRSGVGLTAAAGALVGALVAVTFAAPALLDRRPARSEAPRLSTAVLPAPLPEAPATTGTSEVVAAAPPALEPSAPATPPAARAARAPTAAPSSAAAPAELASLEPPRRPAATTSVQDLPTPSPAPAAPVQAAPQVPSAPSPRASAEPARAPSFDCGSADSLAEDYVCLSPRLAAADRAMASAFKSAVAAGAPLSLLRLQQEQWRSDLERAALADPDAIYGVYDRRTRELRDMQAAAQQGAFRP